MKQRKRYSISAIGIAGLFIVLGSIFMAIGLGDAPSLQVQKWIKMASALLGFGGGYLFMDMGLRQTQRRFNESVAKQEKELGRLLSLEEREKIKKAIRTAVPDSKDSPGFGHPLVRLVARILIVTVPAIILMGVVAAVGAFLAGLGMAILVAELTKRTLDHL